VEIANLRRARLGDGTVEKGGRGRWLREASGGDFCPENNRGKEVPKR